MNDADLRGVAHATPRTGPLTIVTGAVAGDDLESVARSAAGALGCPVAISLPELGPTVVWPPDSSSAEAVRAVGDYAGALLVDSSARIPAGLRLSVPVRIGRQIVGVVAALSANGSDPGSWLDAAAAAAAVIALRRDSSGFDADSARRAFLQMLELHVPNDGDAMLARARRLGCDLSAGAAAVCAAAPSSTVLGTIDGGALLADIGDGRLLGLLPAAAADPAAAAATLREADARPIVSSVRHDPRGLHEALVESAVLFELAGDPHAQLSAQQETYRLLVSVLLANQDELEQLQGSTIAELERYDATHETDLVATLEAFLGHDGSTTETAEALGLHRHTVGYRLARVQEVSGHSPYESDGRERLGLGLKAHRILLAERRRVARRAQPLG